MLSGERAQEGDEDLDTAIAYRRRCQKGALKLQGTCAGYGKAAIFEHPSA